MQEIIITFSIHHLLIRSLTAMLDVIQNTVADGQKASIVGFGAFDSRQRSAREGRNPKTGEKLAIPATTVPAFSAGKLFKEKVAEK